MKYVALALVSVVAVSAAAFAWPWISDGQLDFSSVEAMKESIVSGKRPVWLGLTAIWRSSSMV